MSLPKVFIASPLFNPEQHQILDRIEALLARSDFKFYSARHDSEAYVPKGEDKKLPGAWDAVFNSNLLGLNECNIMIAVLSYALPSGHKMLLQTPGGNTLGTDTFKELELPDSGTVWEMGYFLGKGKLVVGFHPEKEANHLNLMLTHGCDALITGWDALGEFISGSPQDGDKWPARVSTRMESAGPLGAMALYKVAQNFDWSATSTWGAQVGD